MKTKHLFYFALLVFLVTMCKTQQELNEPPRVRQIKPEEVKGFHNPIEMTIAWYPYQDQSIKQTSKGTWKVVKSDGKEGAVPVIMIKYPNSKDSLWLDMNTSNEVLGKLLKHSLMTQVPISRPYSNFLEEARCQNCHPADVKVNFDK